MTKRRIRIRRRDGVRQRYWVGRKIRMNYGSHMMREKIKKDLSLLPRERLEIRKEAVKSHPRVVVGEFFPQTHRKKELVREFEKNPELYQEFRIKKPAIFFHTGEQTYSIPGSNVILLSDKGTLGGIEHHEGVYKSKGLERDLRHELRHITDSIISRGEYDDAPEQLKESSAQSAEHRSVRKYKTPQRLIDHNVKDFFDLVANKSSPKIYGSNRRYFQK